MRMYFMEWNEINDRNGNVYGFYVYRNGVNRVVMIGNREGYLYQEVA